MQNIQKYVTDTLDSTLLILMN